MGDFEAAFPEYAATSRLDDLRASDYGYLDAGGHVYLDYTGAGLPSATQLRAHAARVEGGAYGNPHSENPTSSASTHLVEQARAAVLRFFNASPREYAAIFTPNATGACRLVAEAYPFRTGKRLVLTADNHNSVNGIREPARSKGARVRYVSLTSDLRVNEADLNAALGRGHGRQPGLFAYPAQSNFSGARHPLSWIGRAQGAGYDVLLDAAAFVPTSRLDLSRVKPEFVTVSWYKVFGYPTGVGCLLVRRDAMARLRRPWFSGGTIWGVSVQGGWHKLLDSEGAFEDGTVNFLSIPDVTTGIDWISDVGLELVGQRVSILTSWLLQCLAGLKHSNGQPMARLYGPATMYDPTAVGSAAQRGGTIAFNFLDPAGNVVDERAVSRDAAAAGISLRTGCFCNPGAGEWAFGLSKKAVGGTFARRLLLRQGFLRSAMTTVDDYLEVVGLATGGAVRVSVGLASTLADVESFLDFAERTYRDRMPGTGGLAPRLSC
ncbi:MAG TPA: aminotransferase class V-fold PLP-dependent enzyme [Trebonia sp.]|jgi:selenocysteine lyase/cysteine desulfurase|nr:aminotransferase class V-fold PLP-dependent enzyme [Trebonia sp.]